MEGSNPNPHLHPNPHPHRNPCPNPNPKPQPAPNQAFPDGGFFRGKNLVFDGRRAVGPARRDADSHQAVVGHCLKCAAADDSYEPQP